MEYLKIFNDEKEPVGIASREEVHKKGYWHETFQCWFISKCKDKWFVLLQIRSRNKKDYPNLIDITAAGHIMADEAVVDGVREIQEELGINVKFNELISLGMIDYSVKHKDLIDNELANVFLYKSNHTFDDFTLQKEEVSGIVRIEFSSFYEFCTGMQEEVRIQGFVFNQKHDRVHINRIAKKHEFVPHERSYYETIARRIKEKIEEENEGQ
ncbi:MULTISPECIES: NUDIX hydrolase [Heyndrickxia]|jgi:isopentenyldiphosphate isomerase|uniref:NUDIX domain-containing protein n=1 Tax=Heyndrickxia oleronia TaxID=38875 RepID=A0AAW6SW76_9BACI|nr:NUDIX domain-containing protein [Heyndrickxia oleronia]MCI1590030.1 NUDIX domain-containing protein [Heyndrickxia oleronia]MCI1613344.1 NUDIX domain-containing protein [Heyndrickxia oleronia]MCI1744748.1 NUDIX domain-containing protein [Heyndrickxia oleronia]MCI1761293.1 NUDIX domain-containing protein [Heyndrickxia oleronia]MDH5160834.1 NUDIX domain-containing protein [Heyndrickxia oleronia]